jgi:glycosyltransferase involved in cell wall biosynthesis
MSHGFIFPGEVVGGHEMMAAKILRALKRGAKQVVIISSRTMHAKLVQFIGEDFEWIEAQFTTFRFESTLGYFNPAYFKNKVEAKRIVSGLQSATVVLGGVNANHSTVLAIGSACAAMGVESRIYIPMFHFPHEMEVKPLTGLSNRLSAMRVFRRIDTVLTIDEFWAQRVSQFAKRANLKVQVIHNFLANKAPLAPAHSARSDEKRLCVVGRMDKEQKGMDYLLHILQEMSASTGLPRHTWVFIGDGPHLPAIKRFAEQCQNPNMVFEILGWRNDSQALIKTCDALVLTSRWEGIPTVVAEALMLKLQVFAFDIAAIDRLVTEDERVPCFDTSAYARRITDYLQAGNIQELAPRPYLAMMCDEARFQKEACDVY